MLGSAKNKLWIIVLKARFLSCVEKKVPQNFQSSNLQAGFWRKVYFDSTSRILSRNFDLVSGTVRRYLKVSFGKYWMGFHGSVHVAWANHRHFQLYHDEHQKIETLSQKLKGSLHSSHFFSLFPQFFVLFFKKRLLAWKSRNLELDFSVAKIKSSNFSAKPYMTRKRSS